jgi:hypothetical protein
MIMCLAVHYYAYSFPSFLIPSPPLITSKLLITVQTAGVASVVNGIRNSTFDTLWELLLKLLRYIGSIAVILGMGLVSGLTRLRTGRVNLHDNE